MISLTAPPRWAPARPALVGLIVTLAALALIALASLPTGADRTDQVIGTDRLVASAPVEDVEVILVSRSGQLAVTIAYPGPKGWLGMDLPGTDTGTAAAWAATTGDGPVPALSAVYGRAPGDLVEVEWSDGRVTRPDVASDGAYLAVREGAIRSSAVRIRDAGRPVVEVDGP